MRRRTPETAIWSDGSIAVPLDRANMTAASRVMLPAYVVFFSWVGITYLFTPRERLNDSPTLRYTNTVVDLRALGILLLAAGVLMLVALLTGSRDVSRYALTLAGICHAIIFVVFLFASIKAGASPAAAAWPFLGAAACTASYRSVTHHEVS